MVLLLIEGRWKAWIIDTDLLGSLTVWAQHG
jgi:hypothetical protein